MDQKISKRRLSTSFCPYRSAISLEDDIPLQIKPGRRNLLPDSCTGIPELPPGSRSSLPGSRRYSGQGSPPGTGRTGIPRAGRQPRELAKKAIRVNSSHHNYFLQHLRIHIVHIACREPFYSRTQEFSPSRNIEEKIAN